MPTFKARPTKGTKRRTTVEVRKRGVRLARTFPGGLTEKGTPPRAADEWGAAVEAAIEAAFQRGEAFDPAPWMDGDWRAREAARAVKSPSPDDGPPSAEWTLRRALDEYERTVLPRLKSSTRETAPRILAMWRRHTLAVKRLRDVAARDVQAYIDSRAVARPRGRPHDRVSPTTIRNEVYALSAVFSHASSAAGWALDGLVNPVAKAELPSPRPHRQRRLLPGEEERILAALRAGGDAVEMERMFVLALETGLRMSEVVGLLRPEVVTAHEGMCVVKREHKADGAHERRVWLSPAAEDVVTALLEAPARGDGRLFTLTTTQTENRWQAARARANIMGLRWHDLRRENISRLWEAGLAAHEVRDQAGHADLRTTSRYSVGRGASVVAKLRSAASRV